MEPASSSSDDDDESSVEERATETIVKTNRDKNGDGDGDDDSSSESSGSSRDSSQSDGDSESDSDNDEVEGKEKIHPQSFDDLPSEDSCLDSDSDDDDEEDDDDSGEEDEKEEDMTLADRLHTRRNIGKIRSTQDKEKKSRALALAQERLREMKDKKKRKRGEEHRGRPGDAASTDDSDSNSDSDSDSDSDSNSSSPNEEPNRNKKNKNNNDSQTKKKHKRSKHAPTEASSLRSAYYQRGAPDLNSSGIGVAIGAHKYKPRDPRMQSLSGHHDQNLFEKRYEFLEQVQDQEIERLKKNVRAWKMTGRKGQRARRSLGLTGNDASLEVDEGELNRLIQERSSRRDARMKRTAKRNVKKKMQEEVASGKRGAYYLKKRDLKRMELEARFDELKRTGGDAAVDKVLAKRRKKRMAKDSGFMPRDSSR